MTLCRLLYRDNQCPYRYGKLSDISSIQFGDLRRWRARGAVVVAVAIVVIVATVDSTVAEVPHARRGTS